VRQQIAALQMQMQQVDPSQPHYQNFQTPIQTLQQHATVLEQMVQLQQQQAGHEESQEPNSEDDQSGGESEEH